MTPPAREPGGRTPEGVIPRSEVERREREKYTCPNCGEDVRYRLKDGTPAIGGHYVPPSVGDEGFFYCKSTTPEDSPDGR